MKTYFKFLSLTVGLTVTATAFSVPFSDLIRERMAAPQETVLGATKSEPITYTCTIGNKTVNNTTLLDLEVDLIAYNGKPQVVKCSRTKDITKDKNGMTLISKHTEELVINGAATTCTDKTCTFRAQNVDFNLNGTKSFSGSGTIQPIESETFPRPLTQ